MNTKTFNLLGQLFGLIASAAAVGFYLINANLSGDDTLVIFVLLTGYFMFKILGIVLSELIEVKLSLLEILKTNGTGILEGTCRSKDGRPFIDSVFPEEVQDPVDINFSLGADYLGCYSFDCEGSDEPEDENDLYVSYGSLVLDNSSLSVYVYIYYDRLWEVSRFTARLESLKQT